MQSHSDPCCPTLLKGEWQNSKEELTKPYVLIAADKVSILNDSVDLREILSCKS